MLEGNYHEQVNTLVSRLECKVELPRDWQGFFSQHGVVNPIADDRRRFVRHRIRSKAGLEMLSRIPSIPRQHQFYCVYLKDVCRTGIAFLHTDQLYPGETPVLWLKERKAPCVVVRCVRHNANCFEIGAMFGQRTQSA